MSQKWTITNEITLKIQLYDISDPVWRLWSPTCPTSGRRSCVDSGSWRPTGCSDTCCCSSSPGPGGHSSRYALYTLFCKGRSERNACKNQLNPSRKCLTAKGTRCDKLPAYIVSYLWKLMVETSFQKIRNRIPQLKF